MSESFAKNAARWSGAPETAWARSGEFRYTHHGIEDAQDLAVSDERYGEYKIPRYVHVVD